MFFGVCERRLGADGLGSRTDLSSFEDFADPTKRVRANSGRLFNNSGVALIVGMLRKIANARSICLPQFVTLAG